MVSRSDILATFELNFLLSQEGSLHRNDHGACTGFLVALQTVTFYTLIDKKEKDKTQTDMDG